MLDRVREVVDELKPRTGGSRLLYRGAAFWLASSLVHVGVLAARGWDWSGPLSFRKPIVFSISIGLLLGTVGWVLDQLPDRPRARSTISWALVISSSIEVGLIALQTWRGRASHFNVFTDGDAAILALMGISVGVMSLALVATLVWAVVERPADALRKVAVLAGLALVTSGLGLGQWIIELGNDYVARFGDIPSPVGSGADGMPKFPHAIAFHGIQVFILTAIALSGSGREARWQARMMWLVVSSYTAVLLLASAQAVVGLSPTSLGAFGWAQLIAGGLLLACLAVVGRAWAGPARAPAEPPVPVG